MRVVHQVSQHLGISVDLNDHSVLGRGEAYQLHSMSVVDKASYIHVNLFNLSQKCAVI